MTFWQQNQISALLLAIPLLSLGCGSGIDLGVVKGQVTKEGQPVAGAIVEFIPDNGRTSTAITKSDGTYELDYDDFKGAVIGTHRVQITAGVPSVEASEDDSNPTPPPMAAPPQVIKIEKKFEVASGENTFDFNLDEYAQKKGRAVGGARRRPT
ncbi:hypothetical protein AB1L42_03065 [Thalassoglobus sp. JC818]|uniref:hypothetical protein n=1 Tax=Thalassoglobus sp. JC818 TaxID=3232136 RepID=UPI003457FCF1